MTSHPTQRIFAPWAEAPAAYVCVALAATTLVWKTVGLDFLPGWEEMFGAVGAQYPRRPEALSTLWGIAYLLVYGVLGTVATLASVRITRLRGVLDEPAGRSVRRCARVHGAFHTLIGAHHFAWAVTGGAWGHLTLEQFDLPGLYVAGALVALGTGWHGIRLLSTSTDDPTHRIVRSKIAVDCVSILTFVSVLVCFPMNALGLTRSPTLERFSWAMVFVGPVLWLACDLAVARRNSAAPQR